MIIDEAEKRLLRLLSQQGNEKTLAAFNHNHPELGSAVWSAIARRWAYLDTRQHEASVWSLVITDRGRRVLLDLPGMPASAERLRTRCDGLPDEVLQHMADAWACYAGDLLRPATVMLGLAYEAALLDIGTHLVANKALDQIKYNRARRDGLGEVIRLLSDASVCVKMGIQGNDKHKVTRALDFANSLRERRNDGGHTSPSYTFDDQAEIEEFLISAERHLPEMWRLRGAAPVTQ